MSIRVSSENRLIFPRTRSEMRGWVTPNSSAAWICVMPCSRITSARLIMRSARVRMLAAS
ncbi:hypothetical protein D3C86_1526880 [compost metagenome]